MFLQQTHCVILSATSTISLFASTMRHLVITLTKRKISEVEQRQHHQEQNSCNNSIDDRIRRRKRERERTFLSVYVSSPSSELD